MLMQIIVALIGALIGTYFGAFFLIKAGERKQKKLRNIAIRALKIVRGYARDNGTYDMADNEFNSKLNIVEKRTIIVALHKVGLPILVQMETLFDVKHVQLGKVLIDKDFLDDAIVQIKQGKCDHLFYEDPDKYFNENIRTYTLRSLAKRFVDEVLHNSIYDAKELRVSYPEDWNTKYSWGEKKSIYVFSLQIINDTYYKQNGKPDDSKLKKLKSEIDTGIWDLYLNWTVEAYVNLSTGTNLGAKFLQMVNVGGGQSVE